jgi:hypothetical protein
MTNFKITRQHGFHITFDNGYTVSVQFGPGNYCDNYNMRIGSEDQIAGEKGSSDAEVAVWAKDGKLLAHPFFDGDTVGGRFSPKQVLDLLNWAEAQS